MPMRGEDLERYLDDHLPYERMMLEYTFRKISVGQSQCDWNAYYESFAVHARNLYEFLTNGDGNAKAHEFVPDFKAKKDQSVTVPIFSKLGAQVHHLSPSRPSEEEKKVQLTDAQAIHAWIEKHFAEFVSTLPENMKPFWNEARSKPPTEDDMYVIVTGPTGPSASATIEISPTPPQATNHITIVGSGHHKA